jgi:hypothetical protein
MNTQWLKTKQEAKKVNLKSKLKFLYKKKQNISKKLYEAHLMLEKHWNRTWHIREWTVQDKVNTGMEEKYIKNLES